MQGMETTRVPMPWASSISWACMAKDTSVPVAIKMAWRLPVASAKTYAPRALRFADLYSVRTAGTP